MKMGDPIEDNGYFQYHIRKAGDDTDEFILQKSILYNLTKNMQQQHWGLLQINQESIR